MGLVLFVLFSQSCTVLRLRLNLPLELRDDVLHHGANAVWILHQQGLLGGPLGGVMAVLLAQFAGDQFERLVIRRIIYEDSYRTRSPLN